MEYIKFIERARRVHGNKYDYSKFEELGYNNKVCIICPEHGEFWQLPSKHLYGQGCPKCAHPNINLTKEEFIQKVNEVHNGKYEYKDILYKKLTDKIEIVCPEHGVFFQSAKEHLKGCGCSKCKNKTIGDKKRLNTESFIEKARKVHGDIYEYSKVNYTLNSVPILITCPIHGDFYQLPSVHLNGGGCPKCSGKYHYKTEDIITKFKDKHGDRYDYSKVEYVNSKTKVCITCPEHGDFWQLPSVHLRGGGCPKCGRSKCGDKLSLAKADFIQKSIKIHNRKYDYSKVEYKNNSTEICIICPKHGEFWQTPRVHLRGGGCPQCGLEYLKNINSDNSEDFIRKAIEVHGNRYDYSQSEYRGRRNKVKIICPEHGEFNMQANNHLNGQGCPECAKISFREKMLIPYEKMIERANEVHNNKYRYDKETYIQFNTKMKIVCPNHGEFWQTPTDHINLKHGCPSCAHIESNVEREIYTFLKSYIHCIKRDRTIIDGKELDILIPSKKMAIEFNGLRWHDEEHVDNEYHLRKTVLANSKGYHLIHIFEDEWVNNKEVVVEKLKHILSLPAEKIRIGARKCKIKEIGKKEANLFLERFHIQGKTNSSLFYGAFTLDDKLIGVMAFKEENKVDSIWELTRFATDYNYVISGLGGKMFSFFIKNKTPIKVKSFADRRWTLDKNNNLYTKIGFEYIKATKPDYRYVVKNKRVHKFNFRKQILHRRYGLPLEMTEHEMCKTLGYNRIYDCGLFKYEWKRSDIK